MMSSLNLLRLEATRFPSQWLEEEIGELASLPMTKAEFKKLFKLNLDVYLPPVYSTEPIAESIGTTFRCDDKYEASLWLCFSELYNRIDKDTDYLYSVSSHLKSDAAGYDNSLVKFDLRPEIDYRRKKQYKDHRVYYVMSDSEIQTIVVNPLFRTYAHRADCMRLVLRYPYNKLHKAVLQQVLDEASGFLYRPGCVGYKAAKRSFEDAQL